MGYSTCYIETMEDTPHYTMVLLHTNFSKHVDLHSIGYAAPLPTPLVYLVDLASRGTSLGVHSLVPQAVHTIYFSIM